MLYNMFNMLFTKFFTKLIVPFATVIILVVSDTHNFCIGLVRCWHQTFGGLLEIIIFQQHVLTYERTFIPQCSVPSSRMFSVS